MKDNNELTPEYTWSPRLVITINTLVLVLIMFFYQSQTTSINFLNLATSSLITVIATFLGVYISFTMTINHEKKNDDKRKNKTYESALKLIWSELDLNEMVLLNIADGFKSMPFNVTELFSSYNLLIKVAVGAKTNNFYALISTSSMEEVSQQDDIFNAIQQAYYNMELATNGLLISQDVFSQYSSLKVVTEEIMQQAKNIVQQEEEKIKRSILLVGMAKKLISETLTKRGITFSMADI